MAEDCYWVKRHQRRWPAAAKPRWIILLDSTSGLKVLGTGLKWTRHGDPKFFLKRKAIELLTAEFGGGWEDVEFIYLVRP